jgi:hypothetical protein
MGRAGIEPATHGFSVHQGRGLSPDCADTSENHPDRLPVSLSENAQNQDSTDALHAALSVILSALTSLSPDQIDKLMFTLNTAANVAREQTAHRK